MMKNGKITIFLSWPVIIIAFFLFWPAGLGLFIARFVVDKDARLYLWKFIMAFSVLLAAFTVTGIFGYKEGGFDGAEIGVLVTFFSIALIAFIVSRVLKKNSAKYNAYLDFLSKENYRQIDIIASKMNKSYDEAVNDLQSMIKKGYLKDGSIDYGERKLILPNDKIITESGDVPTFEVNRITVTCKNCGAENANRYYGEECEYCGSILK